jgi:predicted ATPase
MLLVEGFQKFAGIPFGISRIFESLMPQQISANRRKWNCQCAYRNANHPANRDNDLGFRLVSSLLRRELVVHG